MRKNKRTTKTILTAMLLLTGSLSVEAQLLKVKTTGMKIEEVSVNYAPDGYVLNEQSHPVAVRADGSFDFDMNFNDETADVGIDIDGKYYLGAHLVKGKTVEMTITKIGDEMKITFGGAEPELNRLVCQLYRSFDSMKYWSPDPSEAKSNAEYRSLLETEYDKVKALLPDIRDNNIRQYYELLSDCQYRWTKIRIIMDDCEDKNIEYRDNVEIREALKGVEINHPVYYRTNLSYTAINAMVQAKDEGTNEASARELMSLTDKIVTNENLRTAMVGMIGQKYFLYGKGQGKEADRFIVDYMNFAGGDSLVAKSYVTQFLTQRTSEAKTAQGKPAPDITLDTPDGKQVQLSALLKGKFTYIDVWATWCAPCCREIPFFDKLVEKQKNNPKVQFISISTDTNLNAWKAKLEKDKPSWPQYVLTPENYKTFATDWGIKGIPRFIMIDAEGFIFKADAPRPSNDEAEQIIIEQTK